MCYGTIRLLLSLANRSAPGSEVTQGYANGNKFDLDQWTAYFVRIKDILKQAAEEILSLNFGPVWQPVRRRYIRMVAVIPDIQRWASKRKRFLIFSL